MLRRHKKPLPVLKIDPSFSEYPACNLMVTLTDHPDLRVNRTFSLIINERDLEIYANASFGNYVAFSITDAIRNSFSFYSRCFISWSKFQFL